MTCCKFSTGCYLNCDFGSCRTWCQKLEHYKSKICGIRDKFSGQKPSKKRSTSKKKSNHANVFSKVCVNEVADEHSSPNNGTSKQKHTDLSTNAEKVIDVVNDEDEFCECDNDPASYVSLDCSNHKLVDRTRETVRSMVNILGDLHQRCFSEKPESSESHRDSKSGHKSRDSLKKSPPPENLDRKPSGRHRGQKRSSAQEGKNDVMCCKQQSAPQATENCGRQISMSAMIDKIKQGVSFLSLEDTPKQGEDCEEISEEKQKRIDKCKLLENLKDGTERRNESKGASQCDSKNCYLLDRIISLRNSVGECHHKLQQIIPRICMTFDRSNRTLVVKPEVPCKKDTEQCEKDMEQRKEDAEQCKKSV